MGSDCLESQVPEGEEGKSPCQARLQDAQGVVWSCEDQEDSEGRRVGLLNSVFLTNGICPVWNSLVFE